MPVYKDENNGTWYLICRYTDWQGERKQKCKRGFPTDPGCRPGDNADFILQSRHVAPYRWNR